MAEYWKKLLQHKSWNPEFEDDNVNALKSQLDQQKDIVKNLVSNTQVSVPKHRALKSKMELSARLKILNGNVFNVSVFLLLTFHLRLGVLLLFDLLILLPVSNRAAAFLHLVKLNKALADAETTISLKLDWEKLAAILPFAVVHTLGNLFTNMSLGKVAVSFTHTIKAMEPFFSVVLSAMFLGEFPTLWVIVSLIPIVGGVYLASMTEVSFNWPGFWSAMASHLANKS